MSELRATTITNLEGTGSPAFPNGIIVGDVDVSALQDAIDSAIDSATTDNIGEGSNLYYTTARVDSDILSLVDSDYINLRVEGVDSSAVIAIVDSDYIQTRTGTTDNLSEGSSNLYYTTARVDSDVTDYLTGDISTGNITTTGYIRGPSTFTIDPATHGDSTGTLRILGGLTVEGTTTTINSTTLTVDDKNIVLAQGAVDSGASDGAGISVDGSGASILYNHASASWVFNRDVDIDGGTIDNTEVNATSVTGALNSFTSSISTGDWSQASGSDPWIATKTVSGILSTDVPIVDIDLSNVAFSSVGSVQDDWSFVYRVEASADDEIKLYSLDEPSNTLDITILVTR